MKTRQKVVAAVAMLTMINVFPALTVAADGEVPEEISITQESIELSEEEAESKEQVSEAGTEETEEEQTPSVITEETECPVPEEAPPFSASIQLDPQGYSVIGTFTDFPADISIVQPIYSLDGENYQVCGEEWDLHWLGEENEEAKKKLQNQRCVRGNIEPMKSYLEGKLDRFYVKLRLTKKNGVSYDTQAAVIDRGEPQPLPEGITPIAKFVSSMLVREMRPICYYGRYQLTVKENATWEEISAYLPDTLPVEVQLQNGIEHVTEGIVDCPVTWKTAPLSELTVGESVVILDAAEEIMVPGGTLLKTPLGIFLLEEAVGMDQYALTDEVRLVLNVVAEDAEPAGVLAADYTGLKMAFNLKPSGAASIKVYTLREGDEKWEEHSGSQLLAAVDSQPSTASSGYALVLESQQEPFQSYRAAQLAGEEPTPFFVGLEMKGGVYDGKQLVLAWPDTYELPLDLPEFGGAGGNEGNAGAGNKGDSTQEGQRPDLPQNPQEDTPAAAQAAIVLEKEDGADSGRDTPAAVPVEQELFHPHVEKGDNGKEEPASSDDVKSGTEEETVQTLPVEDETSVVSDSGEMDNNKDIGNKDINNKEEKTQREIRRGSYGFLLPMIVGIVIVAGIGIVFIRKYKLHTGV